MSESNAPETIKYLTEDNLKLMYGRLNRRYVVVDALPSVDSLEPADKNVIYVVKETVDETVRYWPNVLDNDAWKPFGIDQEDLDRKADKVSDATNGNFAGLDANGNLTDSGFKASDFKPKQTAVTDPAASGSGIEFIDSISQDTNGVIVPAKKSVQVAVASTSGVGGNAGVMSAADKEKLDGIEAGAQENAIESISIKNAPLDITNKNVDIPLATADSDGLLPHEKFPLIPAEPVAGADRIYSFDDTNGTSWQTIVKEYVGNMILDQQGTPVTDEKGDIMYEEETVPLWLSYKGTEFGARRAYEDHTGQNINEALATKTTMSQVNDAIEAALANYGGFVVVGSLTDGHPDVANPSERFIYLYKDPQLSVTDPYTEWIYTSSHEWDVIGETTIDVTGKQDSLSALPSMAASKFLQTDENQDIVWGNLPQMSGATSSAAGTAGTVPAPMAGDQTKFLKGDGTWDTVADSPLFMAKYTTTTGNAMKAAIQSGKAVMCNGGGYAPSQFGLLSKCDLDNNKYQFLYIYKNTNAYAQQLGDIAFRMVFCKNSGATWFGQFGQLTFKAPTAAGQVMKSASNGRGEFDWTLSTVSEVPTSAVGDAGKVLTVNSSGAAEWLLPSSMTGATASTAGSSGLVPAPAAGDQGKVLTGDGTWSEVEEYTDEYIDSLFAGNVVVIGGRSYPYVQIGNQLWLAENLDYKFQVNGSQIPIGVSGTPSTPASWYYNNDESTYGVNGNKYGLLYNWYAAKYLEDNKSNLLPEGWHVPSTTDWDTLSVTCGGASSCGTKLKSTTGWSSGNGTDNYGFSVFPSSYYYGSFYDLGSYSTFWTSIETDSSIARGRSLDTGTSLNSNDYYKTFGCSVRLVKDAT